VGLFLLIITTIFQMIKVEYTTEGANNSKMSILGKSLKSLSNMILIPALAIFGIFIGNQVLGLIDTATGGGKGSNMSNVIFCTAAADVMWSPDPEAQAYKYLASGYMALGAGTLSSGYGLIILCEAGVMVAVHESFGQLIPGVDFYAGYTKQSDLDQREAVEGKFLDNNLEFGQEYAKPLNVWNSYNIFGINYFLIIFAAAIILKCMISVCFGLIDRIFQSLVLFIISPMVVGMSPVKDSLGSWRTKFIQKVLSAYGVVISMNLFFTLIKLFLQLEVKFADNNPTIFSTSLLSGLVQIIFIITAALGVEKLAGELGSYFGGGNALSDGKTLMQDTSKTISDATKGATTAAKVGVGAVTTGVGIASKVGSGAIQGAKEGKGFKGKVGGFFSGAGKSIIGGVKEKLGINMTNQKADVEGAVSEYDKAHEGVDAVRLDKYKKMKGKIVSQQEESTQKIDSYDKVLNSKNSTKLEKQEAQAKKDEELKKLERANKALVNLQNAQGGDAQKMDKAIETEKNLDKARADQKKYEDEKEEKARLRRDQALTGYNTLKQWGKDGIESIIPAPLKSIRDDWKKAEEKGSSYSEEGQQAYDNVKKSRADNKAKSFDNDPINKALIDKNNKIQTQKIAQATIEKAEFAASDMNKQMNEFVDKLNSVAGKLAAEMAKDEADRNQTNIKGWEDDIKYLKSQMRSLNKDVVFEGNVASNYEITLDLADFKKNMEDAIKRSASKEEINSIIRDQLKKWGTEGNEGVVKAVKQALEEIKSEIGK